MFLFAFLLSLPLFPHVSDSKQFLVGLKSGKNKIIETNIDNGTGTGENGNGNETQKKNEDGKKQSRPKKVENGETSTESHLTTTKTTRESHNQATSESHLTTTDKKSQGDDYFLGGILRFVDWLVRMV